MLIQDSSTWSDLIFEAVFSSHLATSIRGDSGYSSHTKRVMVINSVSYSCGKFTEGM